MFQISRVLLLFLTAMCLVVVIHGSPTSRNETVARRDLSSLLGIESDDDEELPEIDSFQNKSFGDLSTVLTAIKEQFREILEELLSQVLTYILKLIGQMKVNVLKKLGFYTIADILQGLFEGVTEFVVEPPQEDYYSIPVRDTLRPSYGYRPSSLHTLLSAKSA